MKANRSLAKRKSQHPIFSGYRVLCKFFTRFFKPANQIAIGELAVAKAK
jgi:hypothetical protein